MTFENLIWIFCGADIGLVLAIIVVLLTWRKGAATPVVFAQPTSPEDTHTGDILRPRA